MGESALYNRPSRKLDLPGYFWGNLSGNATLITPHRRLRVAHYEALLGKPKKIAWQNEFQSEKAYHETWLGFPRGELTCFTARREGAITDHVSVLFDVDKHSGEIGRGTTNAHWCVP